MKMKAFEKGLIFYLKKKMFNVVIHYFSLIQLPAVAMI